MILGFNNRSRTQPTVLWALGLNREGLIDMPGIGLAHEAAATALNRLVNRAQKSGFKLSIASGYRDYTRQLAIFNAKMRGERPVYGDTGSLLLKPSVQDSDWLHAILRYSALPGTSRHHWGTDFDIWDPAAVPEGYAPQLQPSEYSEDGPFAQLSNWLTSLMIRDDAEGFYRPYTGDVGGVAAEPWHLSHRPSAKLFQSLMDDAPFLQVWSGSTGSFAQVAGLEALAGLKEVELQYEALMDRYVRSYWV
jgi:LAS superfamily LD-carboxypeptidase LdcB